MQVLQVLPVFELVPNIVEQR